jgi:hypothetical protein
MVDLLLLWWTYSSCALICMFPHFPFFTYWGPSKESFLSPCPTMIRYDLSCSIFSCAVPLNSCCFFQFSIFHQKNIVALRRVSFFCWFSQFTFTLHVGADCLMFPCIFHGSDCWPCLQLAFVPWTWTQFYFNLCTMHRFTICITNKQMHTWLYCLLYCSLFITPTCFNISSGSSYWVPAKLRKCVHAVLMVLLKKLSHLLFRTVKTLKLS